MKRRVMIALTAGVVCLWLTTGVFASSSAGDAENAQLISKLEQQARRLERHAQATKGVPRLRLEMQRLRVKNLINRIQAGEAVDPQEIDALLRSRPQ